MGDLFSKISLTEIFLKFLDKIKKNSGRFQEKAKMRGNKKPPERSEYFLTF